MDPSQGILAMTSVDPSRATPSDGPRIPVIDWNWKEAGYLPAWHEPLFALVARYVPDGSRVLEIGAGGSHTLGALVTRRGCVGLGVEPDEAGVHSARRHAEAGGGELGLIRGDGFALPFPDGTFDVVYSLGLIEHFPPARSADLVAEHVRVCRPGGRVIVTVPNFWNVPHTLNKALLGPRYPYYPERSFTPSHLRTTLRRAGLRVTAGDGLLPLWGLAMIPGSWRVIAALDRLGLSRRIDAMRSPGVRALVGYMTLAVGERPVPK